MAVDAGRAGRDLWAACESALTYQSMLVPYHTAGAAADQRAESRLFQIGGQVLSIRQRPRASGALAPPGGAACGLAAVEEEGASGQARTAGGCSGDEKGEALENVGLVVWQSAFVLAEHLLSHLPLGAWAGVRVVELGCGTGVAGVALALAGASVALTDLPHVTPLAAENVAANCQPRLHHAQVVDYAWGDAASAARVRAAAGGPPDVIVGADVVYQRQHFGALLAALDELAAPHTLVFLAFRLRGRGEAEFEQMLLDAGWAVQAAPREQLHVEYRGGDYRLLRCARIDPPAEQAGV